MACTQYSVIPNGLGEWTARLKSRDAGPYTTRDLALQVAVAEARQLQVAIQPVCIIVEDARGEVLAARCICNRFHEHLLQKRLS